MAISAGAIKAGEAFVSMMLDDEQFAKDIDSWKDRLEGVARKARQFGKTFAAVGAVISAPFILGTRALISFAGELDLAAARLGIAGEEFARLSSFAQVTGVSMEALEIAMKTIGERIVQLQAGSNETAQAFQQLGIDTQAFLNAGDNWTRLKMIADGMAEIKDAGLQSGLALRALGESGNRMLPMLRLGGEGMEKMKRKMDDISATDEMLILGRELRIEWIKLTIAFKTFTMQLAMALGPEVKAALAGLTDLLAIMIKFAKANPELTKFVGTVGGIVVGLGLLGAAISGAASAWGVLVAIAGYVSAGLAAIGSTATAVITIIGLLTLALWAVADILRDIGDWFTGRETKPLGFFEMIFMQTNFVIKKLVELSDWLDLLPRKFQRAAQAYSDAFSRWVHGIDDPARVRRVRRQAGAGAATTPTGMGLSAAGIQGAFATQQTLGFAAISTQDQILAAARDIQGNTARMADAIEQQNDLQRSWGFF